MIPHLHIIIFINWLLFPNHDGIMRFPFSYRKTAFFIVTWQHWCYLSSLYWLSTADLLAILFFSWLYVYLLLHGFFWSTLHCMKKCGMLHVNFFHLIFQALYIIIITSKYLAISIISHLFYLGWLIIESMNR